MTERIERGRLDFRCDALRGLLTALFFAGGIIGTLCTAAGLSGFRIGKEAAEPFWKLLVPELFLLLLLALCSLTAAGMFLIPLIFLLRGFLGAFVITGILSAYGALGAAQAFLAEFPRMLIFLMPVTSLSVFGMDNSLRIAEGKPALTRGTLYAFLDTAHFMKAAGLLALIVSEALFRYWILPLVTE